MLQLPLIWIILKKNTAKLGKELYDICCDSVKIPDADLVFLTFTSEGTDYFGMLKMDYKHSMDIRKEAQRLSQNRL